MPLTLADYFQYPYALLALLPIFIILLIVLKRTWVPIKEDAVQARRRRLTQWVVLFTRTLLFLLVLAAIATPFMQKDRVIEGDPVIKIVVDNSSSMELFQPLNLGIIDKLKKKVEVEVKYVAAKEISDVGDALLNSIGPYDSVLLISDGNANHGASMGDVALYASKINSTINAIALKPTRQDAAVSIEGPSKTMAGIDNTFIVRISRAGIPGAIPLSVKVDGAEVYSKATTESVVEITQTFSEGVHKITAVIDSPDYFTQNNAFYKTVRVVTKPKLAVVTEKGATPFLTLLRQVYDIELGSEVPSTLDPYYALLVDDVLSAKLNAHTEKISDFLSEGNGMVVFGGLNSYNNGKYRNSLFESLLPVFVSRAGRKEGGINIVLLIDKSGSTHATFGTSTTVDVEKTLAIGVLDDLKMTDKVAVVAFDSQAFTLSELSPMFQKERPKLDDLISRVVDGGGTLIGNAILKALFILQGASGSKNVILVSDGRSQAEEQVIEASKLAANDGVKIYTVGVGPTTSDSTMTQIAEITNGAYFRATEASSIKILFGDTSDQPESSKPGLVILNSNHFITDGLELSAGVTGYNDVVPKSSGRLLVATSKGDPILTVWRFGLGRVAAVSTDDGEMWAGDLLGRKNSRLLTRTINWAIGEPDRKELAGINIKDTRVGEPTEIIIKSPQQPTTPDYTFYKIDEKTYSAQLTPTQIGFFEALGTPFASNYPNEYERVGLNPELEQVVSSTGGKMFGENDADAIIKHAKARAKRTISSREPVRWQLLIAALVLLLAEIFMRRWLRKE